MNPQPDQSKKTRIITRQEVNDFVDSIAASDTGLGGTLQMMPSQKNLLAAMIFQFVNPYDEWWNEVSYEETDRPTRHAPPEVGETPTEEAA